MHTLMLRSRNTIYQALRLRTSLFSTSTSSSSPTAPPNHMSESRVAVLWDTENCAATPNVNAITEAVKTTIPNLGLGLGSGLGPLQIYALGHNPTGGLDNGADKPPILDWPSQNHPPAHIFLICSDTRFNGILDKLRTNNNILLAAREPDQALDDLYHPASIIWHWKELVKRENHSGTHFELLPGSSFSSWYLIYKRLCDDPSMPKLLEHHHINILKSCYYSHPPVPQIFLLHLSDILYYVPGGLTITELRNELEARKVPIDKVFYGYQKFLHLLLAVPYIVDIQSRPDGQFIVRHASFVLQESFLRKGVLLHSESMVENVSSKVLDPPLGYDEVASTEDENLKKQNVFGGDTDAENSRTVNFIDKPTKQSNQGSSAIEKNSKQSHDASDLKDFDVNGPPSKKLDQEISSSGRHELFNKDSFQSALLSFVTTHPGSLVILNSTSREEFTERLQKEGLSILGSLKANVIRHLVDSPVSEQWIDEFPSKNPRLEVACPYDELSGQKNPIEKSSSEMLADCEKVLDETLFQCPHYLKRKMEAVDEFRNSISKSRILSICEKLLDSILTHNPDYMKQMETIDVYKDFILLVVKLCISEQLV